MRLSLDFARGRWREILPKLGIPPESLRNRHGPCPICGGKDRFRFDDQNGDGSFYCNACGAGNGIHLAQKVMGVSFGRAYAQIQQMCGVDAPTVIDDTERRQREAMAKLWRASKPVTPDCPVGLYLASRGLGQFVGAGLGLRWYDRARHPDSKDTFHAMVAQIATLDRKCANLHLTFLDNAGKKPLLSPVKRVMAGRLPEGAAIRLGRPESVLGIAEGIETALSATRLYGLPVWAAVNGGLLAKWTPPANVNKVVIFGDNDINFAGQAKAYALAHRLKTKHQIDVVMKFPKASGDWNDVLMAQ